VLGRKAISEFLDEEFAEVEILVDVFKEAFVEAFCKYVEDDYYN